MTHSAQAFFRYYFTKIVHKPKNCAMSTEIWPLWLASAVIGVAFHQGYARHQEVDFIAWHIVSIFSLLHVALWYYCTRLLDQHPLAAIQHVLFASAISVVATTFSILLYRGLFHRLHHIPGPILARFTSFYISARELFGQQTHLDLKHLHGKYGDVVRIGLLPTLGLETSEEPLMKVFQVHARFLLQEPMPCLTSTVLSRPHSTLLSTHQSILHIRVSSVFEMLLSTKLDAGFGKWRSRRRH